MAQTGARDWTLPSHTKLFLHPRQDETGGLPGSGHPTPTIPVVAVIMLPLLVGLRCCRVPPELAQIQRGTALLTAARLSLFSLRHFTELRRLSVGASAAKYLSFHSCSPRYPTSNGGARYSAPSWPELRSKLETYFGVHDKG
jgi:hypothetical protein